MIVGGPRELLFAWLAVRAKLKPDPDFRAIGWVDPSNLQLRAVVGYNAFVGKSAQMHFATDDPAAITRRFVQAAFEFPFQQCGLDYLLAPVNSTNEKILRFTAKIGFKEIHRMPQGHLDGGDIVLLQMRRQECRWIKHGLSTVATGEAGG